MKHLAAFFLAITFANSASAQSGAERLAELMSQDFAKQSISALENGDRSAAIGFALRGLPSQPTETNLAAYPDATFALELAYGARVPRINQDREARYSVNSDGTRAFIGHFEFDSSPATGEFPQAIIDPRDGSLVRTLDPQIDVYGLTTPGLSASFSPDGAILAMPSNETLSVYLFRAGDGEYIGELPSGFAQAPKGGMGYEVGFSADGRLYARGYSSLTEAGISVWNVEDQTLLHRIPLSKDRNVRQWPLGWDHEGGFVVQTIHLDPKTRDPAQIVLERWAVDGAKRPLLDTGLRSYDLGMSALTVADTGLLLLSDERGLTAIDLETGGTRFSVDVRLPLIALARAGNAIVLRPRELVSPMRYSVHDLNGNKLEIRGRDAIPHMHDLFSLNGNRIAESSGLPQTTYTGADLAEGVVFYEEVWSGLTAPQRDAIDADRVVRP